MINHIKHLLTATNQHGVHSPFVYDYITKCLYAKPQYLKKKSANVFLKSIAYFNVKTLLLPSRAKDLKILTAQKFPSVQFGPSPYDMIYLDAPDLNSLNILLEENKQVHNNTVLFVDNIYRNKTVELEWGKIKIHKKVRVTVDLFYCGIVFFRMEQAKEHFKIRI